MTKKFIFALIAVLMMVAVVAPTASFASEAPFEQDSIDAMPRSEFRLICHQVGGLYWESWGGIIMNCTLPSGVVVTDVAW